MSFTSLGQFALRNIKAANTKKNLNQSAAFKQFPETFEEYIEATLPSERSYSRRLNSGAFAIRAGQKRFEHNNTFFNELGNEIKYMTVYDNSTTSYIDMNMETHDRIVCAGSGNYVLAGWGNDVIIGSAATHILNGSALFGQRLFGQDGNDTIVAKGYTHAWGGQGNDTLISYGRHNKLRGGFGDDTLISNGNNVDMNGSWGKDTYIVNIQNNAINSTVKIESDDRLIINFKGNNMNFGGITGGETQGQYGIQLFSYINDSNGNNVVKATGELGDFDIRVSNEGSMVTITGQDFFA